MGHPAGRAAPATVITVVLILAGCAPSATPRPSPTPRPTLTPAFGLTWAKAPAVGRSAELFPVASDPAKGPAGPGTAGHPGNFPGQEIMADVTAAPDGRLVAVGYGGLNGAWTARAWVSVDGVAWTESTLDPTESTFAVAVTATKDGHLIAVGRRDRQAMAWTSKDGTAWTAIPLSTAAPDPPERASAIVVTDGGVWAGGSAGPELGDRTAEFWQSVDGGSTWRNVRTVVIDDGELGGAAFAGAEVSAIAQAPGGLVAIGRVGTGQRWTSSVAWRSADGSAWSRIDDPALAGGLVVALAVTPDRILAVGSDGDEREAVAWASADGTAWTRQPREESRLHSGEKIRFTDVVATASGYVGVGNYVGLQYGQGTSWTSPDGMSWKRAPDQAVWGQGEPSSLVVRGDRLVSVGTFGAPDNYVPTAWLSPGLP